jgi:hypothetical protein
MHFEAITYAGGGAQVTAGASSANVAIPQTASGKTARFVGVQAATVTGVAYVKFGKDNTVAATSADVPITANELRIFNVTGQSYMAYIQETTGPKLNIFPIEF